ncbi:MAG: Flp pilus assembly protein CpaB [Alphaproteobacteria bacterium]|nr:MAG: Flp pilus assembly protein CpaB [Alphaproteobacteria bacterium]
MRLVAILALVIGLALAGAAVYFVSERFRAMEAELAARRAQPAVELVEVAAAKTELNFGQVLKPESVQWVKWPRHALPPGAFTTREALFGAAGSEPRSVLRRIEPGEPILASKVTDFGQVAGIAQRLRPGMRAYTIRVDVTTAVSGLLSVGDFVDVYWTGGARGQPITKQILEKLEVIAIDQNVLPERNRTAAPRTVMVEVTPEQAAILTLAQNSGRLSLALRGVEDKSLTGEFTVDQTAIIGAEPVKEEAPAEDPLTVRVRRGTEAATEVIPEVAPTR